MWGSIVTVRMPQTHRNRSVGECCGAMSEGLLGGEHPVTIAHLISVAGSNFGGVISERAIVPVSEIRSDRV